MTYHKCKKCKSIFYSPEEEARCVICKSKNIVRMSKNKFHDGLTSRRLE